MKNLMKRALIILSIFLMTVFLTAPTFAVEDISTQSGFSAWMDKINALMETGEYTDEDGIAHMDPEELDHFTQSVIDNAIKPAEVTKPEPLAYINPETNYYAIIEDDAGLIEDPAALLESMVPVTQYCHAMFKSINVNTTTTMLYAYDHLHQVFGGESATIFLIDMANRNLYIRSDGAICDRMTNTKSTIITDNVYTYASARDYDTCAVKVFTQMSDVLAGYAIAEPMHIIGIALISLLLAMIICFIIINKFSVKKKTSDDELMLGTDTSIRADNIRTRYLRTDKEKIESSGGGGGFSSGGGSFSGGGGGGFSGTGGGHSF